MLSTTTIARSASSRRQTAIDRSSAPPSAGRLEHEPTCEAMLVSSLADLRRWARHKLPSAACDYMDSSDLVQEVALLAFARLPQFTPRHPGSMSAYLRQIARNRICDEFRRTVRRPHAVALDETLASPHMSPLALAIRAEESEQHRRALRRLRAKDRRLLIARYKEERDFAAIAGQFGLPSVDAARMAVSRAERRLIDQLDRPKGTPES
jgi:RNA polymerase sigma factor (sigma-70 family)